MCWQADTQVEKRCEMLYMTVFWDLVILRPSLPAESRTHLTFPGIVQGSNAVPGLMLACVLAGRHAGRELVWSAPRAGTAGYRRRSWHLHGSCHRLRERALLGLTVHVHLRAPHHPGSLGSMLGVLDRY